MGIEKWPGEQIHSHNYRVPETFQDQVVVVIGDSASAHDISGEIVKFAKEVHLSSRSPGVKVSNYDSIWQHSKIECVYKNGDVSFEDGASVHADIILYCTGWVARVLSGKVLLPSEKEMLADIEKHYQRMEEVGKPKHHTHSLHSDEFEYLDWLAAETGEAKVDERLKEMYRTIYKLLAKFLADRGRINFKEMVVETGVFE
ncbi:flavin-containing monooxygenase FMO GS-OX-like 2, partial [Olea europaea var. sylvestris]|uniref:flavin-containing monooxygenase FMO GS-OX-like 2 n=1 Tax=Olea europaea var. sylvestris TaxID=158386 RepID=UPI000C1D78CD